MPRKDAEERLMRPVIAKRHELLCDALARLLQTAGFDVAGRCARADELEPCLGALTPDLTLVDADLACDADVGALLRSASRAVPAGRFVLLADGVEPRLARQTLDVEVDGVVLKCASSHDVVAALRRVHAGDTVFPAGWIAAARRAGDSLLDALSARQVEVLALLAQGLSNEAIAERLFISRNTVKFHVAAIYQRLGVRNRVQAVHALETLRAAG
jgi:DNA-binding NarL/FixJ family response regulator